MKFAANLARDSKVEDDLTALGWRVAVVWECAMRKGAEESGESIADWLRIDPGIEGYLRCDIGSR